MPISTPPGHRRTAAAFIFVTVLLDMVAVGIMAPVLPKLIVSFEHRDFARAASVAGVLGLAWAGMQFLFSPVMGALSDRHGRRPIILASNIGLGLDYVLMALAPSLPWIFLGRLLSGMTSASFSTAAAYITDVTAPEKRAGQIGMLGAAFGLGFIVGPVLGGVLGEMDLRLPFWVAAGLSFCNAAYGFFVLPESLPRERRARFLWRNATPLRSLDLLRSEPRLLALAVAALLCFLGHEALHSTFVLYTDYRYGWSEGQVGLALATVGIGATIVSAALIRPAVARFGETRVILAGLGFGTLGFAAYASAPSGVLFMLGTPLLVLWGLAGPAIQSSMTRHVSPSQQGQLQGAFSSLRGIAGLVGPVAFTQAFAFGVGGAKAAGAPYFLAAVLLGVAALILMWAALLDGRAAPGSYQAKAETG